MARPEEKDPEQPPNTQPSDDVIKVATPPDGGWGWAVVFSSFMVSFLVDGVCFTFGIFFPFFLDTYGGSNGKTQILGSVLNGSYLSLGPIAGALVNKFGCRKIAMIGGFVSAAGLFLCTFSPNLDTAIVLYGFVGGGGFGLIYLPAIVMVGYYFDTKRAFATGIAVCGSGIGGFVFAPLSVFLIETYGWKGAMWVISGIVLNGVVFATFYRPLEVKDNCTDRCVKTTTNGTAAGSEPKCKLIAKLDILEHKLNPVYRCKSVEIKCNPSSNECVARLAYSQDISALNGARKPPSHVDHLSPFIRKDIFYSGSLKNIPEHTRAATEEEYVKKMIRVEEVEAEVCSDKSTSCQRFIRAFKGTFDFSLLASPTFMVYGISCFLCMFGFFIPFNFLPALAKDIHLTVSQGALLISIIGISNTVTRILVGFVSDQPWADCLLINNCSLLIGGSITCFVPFYSSFAILAVYSVLFGAAIAAFVSLRSIIMVELMGIERLTNAFGLVVLCQGLSSFIGSPIAGALADKTGDYNITFYLSGVTLALAGIICFPLRRIARWENEKLKKKSDESKTENGTKMQELSPMLDNES